jgi:hypothetical protein
MGWNKVGIEKGKIDMAKKRSFMFDEKRTKQFINKLAKNAFTIIKEMIDKK